MLSTVLRMRLIYNNRVRASMRSPGECRTLLRARPADTIYLPSVVVSKFATFRYRSPSELRNQNDTRNQYVASVLSIPKFAKKRYRDVANFGIGTLAPKSPHRLFLGSP